MPRQQSTATQLRHAVRELNAADAQIKQLRTELTAYRTRATQAEQSAANWRKRFDTLLLAIKPGQLETK